MELKRGGEKSPPFFIMNYKKRRKNGGFIWHWVAIQRDGKYDKLTALCGETTGRQKRSYWVPSSILGVRFCHKCASQRLMIRGLKNTYDGKS